MKPAEREVSRGHSSRACGEGPNDGKGETATDLEDAMSQKSDASPSAQTVGAVKPQGPRLRVEAPPAGSGAMTLHIALPNTLFSKLGVPKLTS